MECHCFAFCSTHPVVSRAAAGTLLAWTDPLTCSDPELPNSVVERSPAVAWTRIPLSASLRGQGLTRSRPTCGWKWDLKCSQEEEAGGNARPECELNK